MVLKVFQTIKNCPEISFNLKFVILGQKLVIWRRGAESAPPIGLFKAQNTLARIGLIRVSIEKLTST